MRNKIITLISVITIVIMCSVPVMASFYADPTDSSTYHKVWAYNVNYGSYANMQLEASSPQYGSSCKLIFHNIHNLPTGNSFEMPIEYESVKQSGSAFIGQACNTYYGDSYYTYRYTEFSGSGYRFSFKFYLDGQNNKLTQEQVRNFY